MYKNIDLDNIFDVSKSNNNRTKFVNLQLHCFSIGFLFVYSTQLLLICVHNIIFACWLILCNKSCRTIMSPSLRSIPSQFTSDRSLNLNTVSQHVSGSSAGLFPYTLYGTFTLTHLKLIEFIRLVTFGRTLCIIIFVCSSSIKYGP